MPRVVKALPGPSRLSGILAHLRKEPRPTLAAVKKLSLTYASRNDHMGARHFVKEDLPRIRYHNPGVAIEVQPVPNQPKGTIQPTMTIEREDGETSTIPLAEKWSTTILAELLDVAGTRVWSDWKNKQKAAGLPILENYGKRVIVKPFDPTKPRKAKASEGKLKRGQVAPEAEVSAEVEADIEKARSGSGARAILP